MIRFFIGALTILILVKSIAAINASQNRQNSSSPGPYKDYVHCFNALRGKAQTPNTLTDSEVFLPGSYYDEPGVFWFDKTGYSHFFSLKVDYPEVELFRKQQPESDHWIVDVKSMKRLSYRDPSTKKYYHYGFILRVPNDTGFTPLRFVWLKDYEFSSNEDIKYQTIAQFNQALVELNKKWGRRILSRVLVTNGKAAHTRGLASSNHERGAISSIERLFLKELKQQVISSYNTFEKSAHNTRENNPEQTTHSYIAALETCRNIPDNELRALIEDEIRKFKSTQNRTLATTPESVKAP